MLLPPFVPVLTLFVSHLPASGIMSYAASAVPISIAVFAAVSSGCVGKSCCSTRPAGSLVTASAMHDYTCGVHCGER